MYTIIRLLLVIKFFFFFHVCSNSVIKLIQVLKGVPGRPELAIVKHGEIKYKIEKKTTVKDRYKNVMTVKDVVRVTEGPSKVSSFASQVCSKLF